MRKIAVAMAKGGVGKTTTAVNLAHDLAMQGQRVLLVDCDTQDQVAKFLGVTPPHGLYEFITGRDEKGNRVLKKEAIHSARDNLWILAGGIKLVELKNWLGEQPREQRHALLRQSIVPKGNGLDFLIFDCAPGWDILSVNILMAAEEVLCPVALQAPALEGLKTFFKYLLSAQKLNHRLSLKYILPTLYDGRTRQSAELYLKLKRLFTKQICHPIRYNVRLSEAPAGGKTIFEYDHRAVGANDYRKLTRRLIDDGVRANQIPRFF
ncbi:MAG: ParA family protein [Desulfobacteraceae bacterium]|nr:MAG: ParA family protein [Desulfobacteraceae bacterium]